MKLARVCCTLILTASAFVLADCSKSTTKTNDSNQDHASSNENSTKYIIEKKGIVTEADRHVYESLGDVMFYREQSYQVRLVGDAVRNKNRILYTRVVVRVGGQDKSDYKTAVIIQNGEGEMSCGYHYDVKVAKADDVADPECKITVLGDLSLNPAEAEFK